jgi:TonB family protein
MKFKFFSLIMLFSFLSISQINSQDAAKTRVDQMPTYPGCETGDMGCSRQKLVEYVQSNIKMPEAAKKAETGGVVMISFVIGKNGSISDVELKKDPGHGMGKEAIRVVESMNKQKIKWIPGMDDGKKVPVQMVLPVSFNTSLPEKPKAVAETSSENEVHSAVEDMPRFSGCAQVSKEEAKNCTFNNLVKYVQENLKYPAEAKSEKTEGTVMTSFVINKNGAVEKVEILQGLSKECDAEARRIVQEMTTWVPGMQDGNKVNVQMTLPIQFKLSKTPDEAPKQEKKGAGENEH